MLYLDVRTLEEYQERHLKNSKHIPLDSLSARFVELGPKTEPIAVFCRSGRRSGIARELLLGAGFIDVTNVISIDALMQSGATGLELEP
jgi:phage shock protein E